ncbi:MAG: sortase [Anaerolineae bacterium]|nr:sortase [Anaerolineae bacterium]
MGDKRTIDELSVEELERVLAVRRREDRQKKLERMRRTGRTVEAPHNGAKQHPPRSAVLSAPTAPKPALQPARAGGDGQPRFVDAPDGLGAVDPDRDRFWKSFVNQLLLLVEIAAVVGLLYLGYMLVQSIGSLERETAEAQRMADQQRVAALPTIAPTPMLRIENVVLPGGHTPPTSPNGAQPNLNEIPANLQPLVQSQLFQPVINRAPPTDDTPLRLIVPKLNIDQTIVQGTDWEALKQGVGQLQNGVNPGNESGNLVFSAHNDIYGELFRYLDQLEAGDRIQVQTRKKIYVYVVRGWDVIEPTGVHVLESTTAPTATLISCYPYQVDTKRIVVFADRVDSL